MTLARGFRVDLSFKEASQILSRNKVLSAFDSQEKKE